MQHAGNTIKDLRLQKGIKQELMAESLGISQSAYSRIENGQSKISIETLRKIAVLLEVRVEVLFDSLSHSFQPMIDNERVLYQQQIAEKDTLLLKLQAENEMLLAQILQTNQQLLALLTNKFENNL
jgi:transcriptional regulator with XRE-family HTH domain